MAAKSSLRKQFKNIRQALDYDDRIQQEQAVLKHLLNLPQYQSAQSIAAYIAMPGELNLNAVIQHAIHQQKIVLAPIVQDKIQRAMRFFPLNNALDTWQPDTTAMPFNMTTCDLILVPLVAFDAYHNRLGMGGGFYDQLLANLAAPIHQTRPYYCGIAYKQQQAERVPCDVWDIPLDAILTCDGI